MPQGIQPLKDQSNAIVRALADGLRATAAALLFLLLWAATLGPAAMAATLSTGVTPQALHLAHGGEVPPTEDASPSLSATRTTTHQQQSVGALVPTAPVTAVLTAPRRRHLSRHLPSVDAPTHHGPRRRQHRGRAPPR